MGSRVLPNEMRAYRRALLVAVLGLLALGLAAAERSRLAGPERSSHRSAKSGPVTEAARGRLAEPVVARPMTGPPPDRILGRPSVRSRPRCALREGMGAR